jgi:hypothetical protein
MRVGPMTVALALCVMSMPAQSFEVFGFHAGMTVDEARSAAEANAYVVQTWTDLRGQNGGLVVRRRAAGTEGEMIIGFCHGRLANLSRKVGIGLGNLVGALSEPLSRYGLPKVTSSQQATPDGDAAVSISFRWPVQWWQEGVRASQIGASPVIVWQDWMAQERVCGASR